ncbi:MAG: hypothetical protein WC683_08255 [bacterium]
MADDNGNGRVTLAILQTDIRHLTAEVGRLADLLGKTCADQSAQRDRILTLEQQRIADAKTLGEMGAEVKRIDSREKRWDAFLGVLATLLGAVGVGSWLKP